MHRPGYSIPADMPRSEILLEKTIRKSSGEVVLICLARTNREAATNQFPTSASVLEIGAHRKSKWSSPRLEPTLTQTVPAGRHPCRGMEPSENRSRAIERLTGERRDASDAGNLPELLQSSYEEVSEDEAGHGDVQQRRARLQRKIASPSTLPRPRPVRDPNSLQGHLELTKGPVRISGAAFGNHDVDDDPPSANPIAAVEPARPAAPEVLKPSHVPASLTDASEQGFPDAVPYDLPGTVSDGAADGHREKGAEPRQQLNRQGNFTELQKNSHAPQWSLVKFLEGIEATTDTPAFLIAEALEQAKPEGFESNFEWCKHLAQNPAEILEALTTANLLQKLVQGLTNQMSTLLHQAAATSAELNNKFLADGDALLEFGNRDLFDKGLVDWIGAAFLQSALLWRQHALWGVLTFENFCQVRPTTRTHSRRCIERYTRACVCILCTVCVCVRARVHGWHAYGRKFACVRACKNTNKLEHARTRTHTHTQNRARAHT